MDIVLKVLEMRHGGNKDTDSETAITDLHCPSEYELKKSLSWSQQKWIGMNGKIPTASNEFWLWT